MHAHPSSLLLSLIALQFPPICVLGELQSQLCAVFGSADTCYSGTLSGDVYKWKGHNLVTVIKRVHQVNHNNILYISWVYIFAVQA